MNRLRYVLFGSETTATRFWFGLVSIGFGLFCSQINGHWEYAVAVQIMPPLVWSALFILYGATVVTGVFTQYYSAPLLGVKLVGVFCWTAMGITTSIAQHTIGATVFGSLVAMWIVMRYPTWK